RRPGRRLPAGSPPPAAPGPPAPRGPPPTTAVRRRLPGRSRPGSHGTSRTARRCAPTAEPRRPATAARSQTRGPPAARRWPRRVAPARRRRRPAATPDPPSPAQASPGPAQRRPRASRTGHRAAPPRPPPCRRARSRREPLPATAMNGTWRASGESPQSSVHVLHFGQSANAVSGNLAIAWSGTLRALFAALLLVALAGAGDGAGAAEREYYFERAGGGEALAQNAVTDRSVERRGVGGQYTTDQYC